MCYQKEGALKDCKSGVKGIPKAVAAGTINYLESVSVTEGVITAKLEAKDRAGAAIDVSITPKVSNGTINWTVACSDYVAPADGADLSYVESCSVLLAP